MAEMDTRKFPSPSVFNKPPHPRTLDPLVYMDDKSWKQYQDTVNKQVDNGRAQNIKERGYQTGPPQLPGQTPLKPPALPFFDDLSFKTGIPKIALYGFIGILGFIFFRNIIESLLPSGKRR